MDDLDTHICLACQMPILGLDNYVYHKKYNCPARKTATPTTSAVATLPGSGLTTIAHNQGYNDLGLSGTSEHAQQPMTSGMSSQQALQMLRNVSAPHSSPGTLAAVSEAFTAESVSRYSIVNPDALLCSTTDTPTSHHDPPGDPPTPDVSSEELPDNAPSIMDFLSTLELQCRPHPPQGKHPRDESDHLEDRGPESRVSDGLKLASLLNDLNFDSDSEGFDMPSDAEDLLNFNEEDYWDHSYPVGGKGKGKGKSKLAMKAEKGRPSVSGKWRAGEGPHDGGKQQGASIGKRHYEESSDEELAEEDEPSQSGKQFSAGTSSMSEDQLIQSKSGKQFSDGTSLMISDDQQHSSKQLPDGRGPTSEVASAVDGSDSKVIMTVDIKGLGISNALKSPLKIEVQDSSENASTVQMNDETNNPDDIPSSSSSDDDDDDDYEENDGLAPWNEKDSPSTAGRKKKKVPTATLR